MPLTTHPVAHDTPPPFTPLVSGSPTDTTVQTAAQPIFGDLARLLLSVEKLYTGKIIAFSEEINKLQNYSRSLIDASNRFSDHIQQHKGDKKDAELSKDLLALCRDLEEKGFHLLSDGEIKVSLDRVNELKTRISLELEQPKLQIQSEFNKVQTKVSELQSIYECFRMIAKSLDRMMGTIIGNQTR